MRAIAGASDRGRERARSTIEQGIRLFDWTFDGDDDVDDDDGGGGDGDNRRHSCVRLLTRLPKGARARASPPLSPTSPSPPLPRSSSLPPSLSPSPPSPSPSTIIERCRARMRARACTRHAQVAKAENLDRVSPPLIVARGTCCTDRVCKSSRRAAVTLVVDDMQTPTFFELAFRVLADFLFRLLFVAIFAMPRVLSFFNARDNFSVMRSKLCKHALAWRQRCCVWR